MSTGSTAVTTPSTVTYLYGGVSTCAQSASGAPTFSCRPFRDSRSVMNSIWPPGWYRYQIGAVTGAAPGSGIDTTATCTSCLLYTSDAADERSSVDLGGRRII